MDESGMRNQYVGKNISELQQTIDSVTAHVDSIGYDYGVALRDYPYFSLPKYQNHIVNGKVERTLREPVKLDEPMPIDINWIVRAINSKFGELTDLEFSIRILPLRPIS